MRIGIDVKTIAVHGAGISAVLTAMLPRLVERTPGLEWVAFGPAAAMAGLPPAVRPVPLELARGIGGLRLPLYDQWQLRSAARRHRVGAFYSPYFDAPVALGVPTIVTMHDAVHFRFPQLYPVTQRVYYQGLMRSHARRAAAVVTDSAFSGDELVACLRVPRDRLHVVPLGLPVGFRRPEGGADPVRLVRYRLNGSYILYPGGVEPRKNLARLLGGYARFRQQVPGAPALALTGVRERYTEASPIVQRLGLGDALHFTGRVAADDMPHVYAGACAVVYPSLYEGFGLPLLEAMAVEVPVACSNSASLPEVGGDAAYYFDPLSEEAIAAGLQRVTLDERLRARLVAAGRERVTGYSILTCADRLAAILTQVLGLS